MRASIPSRPFRPPSHRNLLAWRGLFLGFAAMLSAAIPANSEETAPVRVASINLCADELLLALADPGQIAALSTYATDPTLSFMAKEAEAYRHDAGNAETIVEIAPDVVLAGRFTRLATREMLSRLGFRLVLLDSVRSIDASIEQIREVAALLEKPERGEALIAEIEGARSRAEAAAAPPARRPTALVYQRRGYVTGAETLTGELLRIAGFDNRGGAVAGASGGFVDLEQIVAERPDFLVVASAAPDAEDQGTALLSHPALAGLYPPERRIVLPEKLTVCGGPSLPAALDRLSEEARRVAGAS